MQKKKIIALSLSVFLFLTPLNASAITQNKNLVLNDTIVENKKEVISSNLKNTVIQINKLAGRLELVKENFITIDSGIFKIGFNEEEKRLRVFDIKSAILAPPASNSTYFSLTLSNSKGSVKREISFTGNDIIGWSKELTIEDFHYEYGDILTLKGLTSKTFYIHGKILGLDKDYPYVIPNDKVSSYSFKITKEGLEILKPFNYKESLSTNIIDIRSEFWDLNKYMHWILNTSGGFKIRFDEKSKKLKVFGRRDEYYLSKSLWDKVYFKILLLDKNKKEKFKLDVYGYDTGKNYRLNSLNNVKYAYGDVIKIWCKSPSNQRISGKILEASTDYSKGMAHVEDLEELAFEITPRGLKEISNKAPKIFGADDLTIKKGENFYKLKNVTALDDIDGDITKNINVIGDVNTNVAGYYNLKYEVSDSNNKKTEVLRKIYVKEGVKLEENKIKVEGSSNKEKFNITFDDFTKSIKVNDRVNEALNFQNSSNKYFSIKILDKNSAEKLYIELKGNDLGISEKLNKLHNFTYEYGDTIKIYHMEPNYLKINGNVINNKEDYSKGLSLDGILNTKFEITKNGLKAIYNESPVISGIDDLTLKVGEAFDPLEGVTVIDDFDNNLVPTIKGIVDINTVGIYTLNYIAKDSEGREINSARNITVRTNEYPVLTGIEDITIKVGDNFNNLLGIKAIDKEDSDLTKNIIIKGNVNTNIPGIYKLNYYVEDTDGNIVNEVRLINVKSNNKPILMGIDNLTIKINEDFDALEGITAIDTEDLDLTNSITIKGTVDINKLGVYDLIYLVKDSDNNETIATRRVTVRSDEKPAIKGVDDITIKVNDTFNPLNGITAEDFEDKDLTDKIIVKGNVNTSKEGIYPLTYLVEDSDGNITKAMASVTVKSNTKPKFIALEDVTIPRGEPFDPYLSITALDKEEGDISHEIKIKGNVDINVIGLYELIYSIKDFDGNETIEKRIITVRSNEKPTIVGSKLVTLKVGDSFDPLEGIEVQDTESGDLKNSLIVEGKVNINVADEYYLTYSVTDNDGNETVFKRKVVVKSNDKPIITGANDITIKVGENFNALHGIKIHDTEDGDLTKNLKVNGNIDTSTVGTYNIIYSITDKDKNKVEKIRKITIRSNEKPIITGANAITIKIGDKFNVNFGVKAYDKEDKDLTDKINISGTVDTTKEGVYTLIYSVEDSDGNNSSIRRRVKVRSNDKPNIIVDHITTLKIGTTFDLLNDVIATDGEDGILTNKINVTGKVDTSKLGEYLLIYSVEDSDRNKTFESRKIIIQSNEKPIITGTDNKIIKVGDAFDPLQGIVATDFEDKDLTNKIIVTGKVNKDTKGEYKLNYSVTDSDKNTSIEERIITVETNNKPEIFGVEDTVIKVGENFESTSSDILAMDDEDGDISNLVSVKGNVDNNIPGEYKLVYYVTDKDGNVSTAERKIIVKSNEKPIINGIKDIIIKSGDVFNPLEGVTAFDKEDGDLTKKINIKGKVDTSVEGDYEIVYSVVDSDNNKVLKNSLITVKSNEKPKLLNVEDEIIKEGDIFNANGEEIVAVDKEDGDITNKIKVEGDVDTSLIGEYILIYSVEDNDGNITKATKKVVVRSNNPPIIEGAFNKTIKVGESFDPMAGVIAKDLEDIDLTNKIKIDGKVNNAKPGLYKLKYNIHDSDGNTFVSERNIIVRSNDKPVIIGTGNLAIKMGDTFDELLGVEALDTENGDLTDLIEVYGTVDTNVLGEHKLTYKVIDFDENETLVERIITVRSNEKPIIKGVSNISIKIGDTFNPLEGITAMDKEDGDLSSHIEILGKVNTNKPGIYTLFYKVKDTDDNLTKVIRRVTVSTNEKPIIFGIENIEIKQFERVNPMISITAKDKEDGDLTKFIKISGKVDSSKIGEYIITYSVNDKDGNEINTERKITITSNEKPVISEFNKVILKEGEAFNALYGISALDKEDGDISYLLKSTGTVNTNKSGIYKVNYSVTDNDGNKCTFQRKIVVRSNEKPKIFGNENITLNLGDFFDPMAEIIAKDKEDGDLTKKIIVKGDIDTSIAGEYNLNYSVIDSDNNETIVSRKVIINDTYNIEIVGVDNIEIEYGEEFDPMKGIKAIDSKNRDVTSSIILDGVVNTQQLGKYDLSYTIKNKDGSEIKSFRQIAVIPKKYDEKFLEEPSTIIKELVKDDILKRVPKYYDNTPVIEIPDDIIIDEIEPIVPEETKEYMPNVKEIPIKKDTFINKFKILPPEDKKPLPLWIIGLILIISGKKIRKKEKEDS